MGSEFAGLGAVMLDVAGHALTLEEKDILRHPQVGGVILFSRNFDSPQQLMELNRQIRECKPHVLIAVDHEGGRVQRFRTGFTRIPSMQVIAQKAPTLLSSTAQLMAWELLATGIDFTFAPVLDRFNPQSQVIGDRAFSECVNEVTTHAGRFIDGLHLAGMAAIGKHFPGHGGVAGDTHLHTAIDERDFAEIAAKDLVPFKILANQLQGIMPAHVIFPCVSEAPVGFCNQWLGTILREQLQFNGAIFSDDLSMAAAKIAGDALDRGMAAINAGCTMALMCNQPQDAIALIEGFEAKNIRVNETLLLTLSARKARAVNGFSWQSVQKTAAWKQTNAAINQLNEQYG